MIKIYSVMISKVYALLYHVKFDKKFTDAFNFCKSEIYQNNIIKVNDLLFGEIKILLL